MAIILLTGSRYAFAQTQNTASNPYLGSKHSYRIVISKITNNHKWVLTNKLGITYNLSASPQPWDTLTPAIADGGYESIKIIFDDVVFKNLGTWYLQYYETDATHSCVSAREFVITLAVNTFYLVLANDTTVKCSQSGLTQTYNAIRYAGDKYNTDVIYTVTMNKSSNYDPTSWSFDTHFSQAISGNAIEATTTTYGVVTIQKLTDSTDYRITVTHPTGSNPNTVKVTLKVVFYNPVFADVTRSLTVSNGKGIITKSGTPDAITEDNTTTYPLSPLTPGDRTQNITILSIPLTRDITFGVGDSTWSASAPAQNSTHKYTVQLGDFSNDIGNAGTGWALKTSSNGVVDPSKYTITQTTSSPNSNITCWFNMDQGGTYKLVFTEVGVNGSTTIREYLITIAAPFDVDIVAEGNYCADSSGHIETYQQVTNSNIDYTVNLQTAGYKAGWSFTFTISIAGINTSDLDVNTITVTGGTFTKISTYSGSVNVAYNAASPVTQVVVHVAYKGVYGNEYLITATLSSVTGSFNEVDADGANDKTTHKMYKMPQARVLAGVI